jgi:hypothetical protein
MSIFIEPVKGLLFGYAVFILPFHVIGTLLGWLGL